MNEGKPLPRYANQTIWPYSDFIQHRLYMKNVSQIDDCMGDIETAVLFALVRSRGRIAVNVVTLEVAA